MAKNNWLYIHVKIYLTTTFHKYYNINNTDFYFIKFIVSWNEEPCAVTIE